MGLDISFTEQKEIKCPKCGETVMFETISSEHSCGRCWYDFLEKIGYYVPHEERPEDFEDEWYGKDMVLTEEQAQYLGNNVPDCYNKSDIEHLIYAAMFKKHRIIVNADW